MERKIHEITKKGVGQEKYMTAYDWLQEEVREEISRKYERFGSKGVINIRDRRNKKYFMFCGNEIADHLRIL